jgi:hypothetical protein
MSETDLLNDALSQVGAAHIASISDGSVNANHCKIFYPKLRDGYQRSAHWKDLITRVQLAQDVTPPVTGFAYAYTLPPDNLKVIDYMGANSVTLGDTFGLWTNQWRLVPLYKIEHGKLLSNDGLAFIVYLRRDPNPDNWDPLLYQVVATHLAAKLAMAITKDAQKSDRLLGQAMNILLPVALAVNGQEGSIEPFLVDDLLWGR